MPTFQRILVPVDDSEPARRALALALQLAKESGGHVRVLHVFDELDYLRGFEDIGSVAEHVRTAARKLLDQCATTCHAAGVEHDTRLREEPGRHLADSVNAEVRSWKADLVVVGTHGRRGVARLLLGSGAEQILRASDVPVLLARAR